MYLGFENGLSWNRNVANDALSLTPLVACNACYIGKTVNTLQERFLVGKETAHLHPENWNSPLQVHLKDNPNHSFSFDDVEILDKSNDKDLLFIKESLYIMNEWKARTE